MSLYTTTRTEQHQQLLNDYRDKFTVELKHTVRAHHYYFDQPFRLSTDAACEISDIIGVSNTYSYMPDIGSISTEFPLSEDVLNKIEEIIG